ncbi:MAG: hypothetical protein ACLQHL_07955 [Candidatus Cybelea sp.]
MDDASLLYVSDCPESFTAHGRLFYAPLAADGNVIRLLFDHVNRTTSSMRVMVGVFNTDGTASSIVVRGGSGGPDGNFMGVGHTATEQYVAAVAQNSITSIAVPANGYASIFDATLAPLQCVAGIYDIDCGNSGVAYEVRVIACNPVSGFDSFDVLPEAPDDGKSRRGVFDITNSAQPQPIAYSGAATPFAIGALTFPRAPIDPYAGPQHQGEYGVLCRFDCTLQGTGAVWLYQSARGGAATATYLVNGTLLASHSIPAGPRSKVASFQLVAGQPQSVQIVTVAEINSSYPLQLSFDTDDSTLADARTEDSPIYLA